VSYLNLLMGGDAAAPPAVTASVDMFAATGNAAAVISLPNDSVLPQTTYETVSVEAWIKPSAVPYPAGKWGAIIALGGPSSFIDLTLKDTGKLQVYNGTGAIEYAAGLSANVWVHVAYVSGTVPREQRWYINGVNVATGGGASFYTLNSAPRRLGGYGAPDAFRGRLSDLRVWNTQRSAAEILANYNKRLTGSETGLVGYWKMNEGSGTTVADSTSGAATGTFSSATDIKWVADMPTFV
jgi:hypothetical protein